MLVESSRHIAQFKATLRPLPVVKGAVRRLGWSIVLASVDEYPDPDLPCAIDKPRAGSDIPMLLRVK